jgi:protein TonB
MALRALLFSSDGSATSSLCEILTDLSIEAEICTEVLVASERVTRENYDAVVVDWDQEPEAIALLKAVREKKAGQSLNLALVKEDKQVGHALQQGANSVIKKPIDHRQAQDTLSTARDLILSRRAEQKYKEARIAATNAEAAEFAEHGDAPAQKTGFLQQTAPRSAFEAATQTGEPEATGSQASGWQAARGPEELRVDREQVQELSLPEQKRWDDHKAAPKIAPKIEEPAPERAVATDPAPQDSTGVFSSLPEESEPEAEARPKPHSQRLGFVLVACLLIAGVLYVWAPGDSYGGRLSSVWHLLPLGNNPKSTASAPPASPTPVPSPEADAKTDDPPADSAPIATTDVDPTNIHIIETKPIPKTGAQMPPSNTPPPGSDQAQAQSNVVAGGSPAGTDPAASLAAPQQPVAEAEVPPTTSAKPAIVPIAQQQRPSVPLPTGDTSPTTQEGRTGVIIPDSLKNAPSPAPGSNLEATSIPEEVARGLLVQNVEAVYPAAALSQHLEGVVVLQVWVAKDGSVQDVKLMKGYIQLGRASVDAVRQWRFKPYTPDGKPINFQTPITLSFKNPNG